MDASPPVAELFTAETTRRYREEYLPRLEEAVRTLPESKLWWRPHDSLPTVGHLLRHLEGNVRQWMLGALGGAGGDRTRRAEFEAPGEENAADLLARLRETVEASCTVIDTLDAEELQRTYRIQGWEVTGLAAVYHVLEHFGWHLGQIVWIAKATAGADHGLAFYDDEELEGR